MTERKEYLYNAVIVDWCGSCAAGDKRPSAVSIYILRFVWTSFWRFVSFAEDHMLHGGSQDHGLQSRSLFE